MKQSEIRKKVQAYFKAQLDQYLNWLDQRGLSQNALANAREEVMDHESFMDINSANPIWLPVDRFKRKMEISDADWNASLPRIATELRKGRRDMLRRVLEAAERLDYYSYDDGPETAAAPPRPAQRTSAELGTAIDDFIAEHSRQWTGKTISQNSAYLNVLVEYFGRDKLLGTITRQDANEVKKLLQALPVSRNTKPKLRSMPLKQVIEEPGQRKIAPKTINSHIQMFKSFFDWAERHGYAPHTLFDKMKVAKAKNSDTERKPFASDQARLIYTRIPQVTR